MDDRIALKLAQKFKVELPIARALAEHGYDKPVKIRRAKQSDLEKVPGVGQATAKKLKERG